MIIFLKKFVLKNLLWLIIKGIVYNINYFIIVGYLSVFINCYLFVSLICF